MVLGLWKGGGEGDGGLTVGFAPGAQCEPVSPIPDVTRSGLPPKGARMTASRTKQTFKGLTRMAAIRPRITFHHLSLGRTEMMHSA